MTICRLREFLQQQNEALCYFPPQNAAVLDLDEDYQKKVQHLLDKDYDEKLTPSPALSDDFLETLQQNKEIHRDGLALAQQMEDSSILFDDELKSERAVFSHQLNQIAYHGMLFEKISLYRQKIADAKIDGRISSPLKIALQEDLNQLEMTLPSHKFLLKTAVSDAVRIFHLRKEEPLEQHGQVSQFSLSVVQALELSHITTLVQKAILSPDKFIPDLFRHILIENLKKLPETILQTLQCDLTLPAKAETPIVSLFSSAFSYVQSFKPLSLVSWLTGPEQKASPDQPEKLILQKLIHLGNEAANFAHARIPQKFSYLDTAQGLTTADALHTIDHQIEQHRHIFWDQCYVNETGEFIPEVYALFQNAIQAIGQHSNGISNDYALMVMSYLFDAIQQDKHLFMVNAEVIVVDECQVMVRLFLIPNGQKSQHAWHLDQNRLRESVIIDAWNRKTFLATAMSDNIQCVVASDFHSLKSVCYLPKKTALFDTGLTISLLQNSFEHLHQAMSIKKLRYDF